MLPSENISKVQEVDINEILPNRFQPRRQFDEDEILELSDSIKEHGIIQPIVVRTIGDKYEIIAGERRYKASVLAGLESVPVIVKNLNDKDSAEIALIENIQRKNLTPIEEALSYKQILDMGYLTQEKLATKLGKSQSAVANKIRLLNLSDEVQEALLENKISERHARSLLRLSSEEEQNKMLNRIIDERLTVRKTDEEIEKIKNGLENIEEIKEEKEENNMDNNINIASTTTPNDITTQSSFSFFGNTPNQSESSSVEMPTFDVGNNQSQGFDMFTNSTPSINISDVSLNSTPEPVQSQNTFGFNSQFTTPGTQANPFSMNPEPVQNINTLPEQPVQSIDPQINPNPFGINPQPIQEPEPAQSINTLPEQPVQSVEPQMNPNPFGINPQPIQEPAQSISTLPEQPVQSVEPQINPNPFGIDPQPTQTSEPVQNISSTSIETQAPSIEIPSFDLTNNQPTQTQPQSQNDEIQFDSNGMIVTNPQPTQVPVTSPIIDQTQTSQSSSVQSPTPDATQIPNMPETPNNTQPEQVKVPEPIIVTDYSKQYDPIMPNQQSAVQQKVPLREVINAIRECSQKIEQFGYKIDLEEYDLENIYQVTFKVEK